jgi:rubrerythrin
MIILRGLIMKIKLLASIAFLMIFTGILQAKTEKQENDTTLRHLQHAFNGESNADAFYKACAKKADQEGYHQVASLFRAAAFSESIHAQNHAKVIQAMHGEAKAQMKKPEVKSTKENVKESYRDETEESTKMYPEYVKQAKDAGNKDAARTFEFAGAAEKQHAKYFKEAMDNLENWRSGQKAFYVCTTCGYTTDKADMKSCPVCKGTETFKEIK